ncbi:MAG: hypothetical protein R2822_22540 [Spirosomataceae bacterium]
MKTKIYINKALSLGALLATSTGFLLRNLNTTDFVANITAEAIKTPFKLNIFIWLWGYAISF